MPSISFLIADVFAMLGAVGTAYFALTVWAARGFHGEDQSTVEPAFTPPVSIL